MAAGAVVVNRNDGVDILLADGADGIVGPLLHLRIGALHGVELDVALIFARGHARHGAAAHADAVVVAAQQHHLVALARFVLHAVGLLAVTDAAGLHDDLVVAVLAPLLLVLEGEQRAADERLAELVAEVAGAVRRLDEDVLRSLVKPGALLHPLLPVAPSFGTRIGGHVDRGARHGESALAARDAVADFAAGSGRGAVERLHGGGEVVGLGLDGDDALEILHLEVVGAVVRGRRELLGHGALQKGAVVLVGRSHPIGVALGGPFDELEKSVGHRLAVDDELAVENLVAAVLRIDLREAEHLAVGERTPHLLAHALQVGDFIGAQGQTLLAVVLLHVLDVDNRVGLLVDGEDALVESVITAVEHGVEGGVLPVGRILLDAAYSLQAHVLGNLHGIGAPRGYHLAPRAHVVALDALSVDEPGARKQPFKCSHALRIETCGGLHCENLVLFSKK